MTKSYLQIVKIQILFLFFIFGSLVFSPKIAYAMCWCKNGAADNCRCACACGQSCVDLATGNSTPPKDCSTAIHAGQFDGVDIYCDTQGEANSFFATRSPMCGSMPETVPACCHERGNSTFIMCWGGEFTNGATNIPINGGGSVDEPLIWSGVQYCSGSCDGETINYHSCGSNVYKCAAGGFVCEETIPPVTVCGPQVPGGQQGSVNPLFSVCGVPTVTMAPPGPPPQMIPWPSFPPNSPIPCNETRDPEFHSLRPYQASPCNQSIRNVALYCGNDLMVHDSITITKNYNWGSGIPSYTISGAPIPTAPITPTPTPYCTPDGTGHENCSFTVGSTQEIAIDLSGAEFPIMGYTEPSIGNFGDPAQVINSRRQEETVSHGQKVNNYVSWYANGINQRAEYGVPLEQTPEGRTKIVDLSGPLKKLLAFDSQTVERQNEINKAGITRHNQVVACLGATILGLIPVPCYSNAAIVDIFRVTSAGGLRLPPLRNSYTDNLAGFVEYVANYIRWHFVGGWNASQYIPFSSTEDRVGRVRIVKYTVQDITSGQNVTNSTVLTQDPSNLYFSHMKETDELANSFMSTYLSSELNRNAPPTGTGVNRGTFCDTRAVRSNPGDQLFPTDLTARVNFSAVQSCNFVDTQSRVGNLCKLPTSQGGLGGECTSNPDNCGTVYSASDCPSGQTCARDCKSPTSCQGVCGYNAIGDAMTCCPNGGGGGGRVTPGDCDCDNGWHCHVDCTQNEIAPPDSADCHQEYQITFNTVTETPLATSVWAKLVASPVSVFRRFFPRVENKDGRPVRSIWDLPASTGVLYTSLTPGVDVTAGDPTNDRGGDAQLYFPHIGGIQQYFLQCIQTALRPKGYALDCPHEAPPPEGPQPMTGGPIDSFCMAQALTDYMNTVIDIAHGCGTSNLHNLGIFTNYSGSGVDNYIRQVQPNLVVLLNDEGFSQATHIKGLSPNTRLVGRTTQFSDNASDMQNEVGNTDGTGPVFNRLTNLINSWGSIGTWQGYNEVAYHVFAATNNQQVAWSTQLALDRQAVWAVHEFNRTHGTNKHACIGNFKEGWPRSSDFNSPAYTNYVSNIMNFISTNSMGSNVFLCVHEHESATTNTGNWTFGTRYLGWFQKTVGSGITLPVLVTVAGYDSQASPTIDAGVGWRVQDPSTHAGPIPAGTYRTMLLDYQSAALAHGAQGVAVFSLGLSGWDDTYGIAPLLTASGGAGSCTGTGLTHIKLLSPAFNMTSSGPGTDEEIAAQMITDGANFDALNGLAGNSYNCCGNTITGHVTRFLQNSGLGALNPPLPIMITETGVIDGTLADLGNEMGILKASTNPDYLGALFFNAFGTGSGEWNKFIINDYSTACHGTCGGLGVNSAAYYSQDDAFYRRAQNLGMTRSLEISNADDETTKGVMLALSHNLSPILRLGTVDNPGPDAETYGYYLQSLDKIIDAQYPGDTGKVAWAIAGPNEPQSEHWVAPECELSNLGTGDN